MNQAEFVHNIKESYAKCIEILEAKNHDYAKDTDPFANFRFSLMAGVSVQDALLVRILDKMARISNLAHKTERRVIDEKVEDTIDDACNYLQILKEWMKNHD